MTEAVQPTGADGLDLPPWFDPTAHRHTANGIVSVASGVLLAGDGHPLAGPARARSLAAAGREADELGLVSDAAIAAWGNRFLAPAGTDEQQQDAGIDAGQNNAGSNAGEKGE